MLDASHLRIVGSRPRALPQGQSFVDLGFEDLELVVARYMVPFAVLKASAC